MIKGKIWLTVALLSAIGCSDKPSHSPREIFDRHVSALGNGDRQRAFSVLPRSVVFVVSSNGREIGTIENLIRGPVDIVQVCRFGDSVVSRTLENGRSGRIESGTENRELSESEMLVLRLAASYSDFLGFYRAGKAFRVPAIDRVNDEPCYRIEVETGLGDPVSTIFVSTRDFLVRKRAEKGITIYYTNETLINNIMVPRDVVIEGPGGAITVHLQSLTFG